MTNYLASLHGEIQVTEDGNGWSGWIRKAHIAELNITSNSFQGLPTLVIRINFRSAIEQLEN